MKVFLLLATISLTVNAASYEDVFNQEWNLFKAEFRKSYTPEEENYRMNIFRDNKYAVAQHNLKYHAGLKSFEMGINEFSDMLPEEVDKIYNGYNKENRLRARKGEEPELPILDAEIFVPTSDKAPDSVNWVSKGAVAPVRHQGKCGSCYAFAALAALEGHVFLKTKNMTVLSPQNIIDCSGDYGNKDCNGGLASNALKYVKDNGVNAESVYPYEAKQGKCRMKKDQIAAKCNGYVQVTPGKERLLELAVAEGPVSVAIDASLPSFQQYKNGVFSDPKCSSFLLGHAVLLVGYGKDPATKKEYWLVKNSWGTSWGDQGYVKIARNEYNMCGIATRPVYPKL